MQSLNSLKLVIQEEKKKKGVADSLMSLTDCDSMVSMTETSPALSHLIYVTGHAGACV